MITLHQFLLAILLIAGMYLLILGYLGEQKRKQIEVQKLAQIVRVRPVVYVSVEQAYKIDTMKLSPGDLDRLRGMGWDKADFYLCGSNEKTVYFQDRNGRVTIIPVPVYIHAMNDKNFGVFAYVFTCNSSLLNPRPEFLQNLAVK